MTSQDMALIHPMGCSGCPWFSAQRAADGQSNLRGQADKQEFLVPFHSIRDVFAGLGGR